MAAEETPRKRLRADPHRVMAWVDTALQRTALRLGLTALLLVALTVLLSPRFWRSERIVTGLEAGKLAEGNIKATRTFVFLPPEEKIEKKRRDAEARVPYVFDHREELGDILSRRIKRAFEVLTPADAGVPPPAATPPGAARAGEEAPGGAAPPQESFEERRKQFSSILQLEVTEQEFRQLLQAPSSREVRGILLALVVEGAMKNMVITRRQDLQNFRNKPILVRHLRDDKLSPAGEEVIDNLGKVKDLKQIEDEIQAKADVHAAKLPQKLAKTVVRLAQGVVVPNLTFNSTETNARIETARRKIRRDPITYVKGQVIVRDGDPVTAEDLQILEMMEPKTQEISRIQIPIGVGLFTLVLLLVQFRYARRGFKRFYDRPRDLLAMGLLLVGLVGLCKSVVALGGGLTRGQELPVYLFAIPLAAGPMLVRLLISSEAAALFATVLAAVCGVLVDQSLTMTIFYLVTGLVGASGVSSVQSRSTILRAGLWSGLVGAAAVLGFCMFREQLWTASTFYSVASAVAGGLLCAFTTLALLPAMEWLFAYTTDVTLLELANLNHPLLRDLILRAPGTYHHSMVVGSLSEAACEAIGANGLLARVASYYHDIGKSKNSEYFAENFKTGESPHNRLKPSMSALIIRSHVKDTVEMLREHSVPEMVIETATQHHGRTLIEYFYNKAKEGCEAGDEIDEESYRYPGPKPQTREAGVIMLADGVEAAARSLAEPTEDRLRAVVQRIINTKFTDGQLDHCDLTLRDLHLIARSFLQVLGGIYHQRPTYPWQQKQKADESKRETPRQKAEGETEEGGKGGAGEGGSGSKGGKGGGGKGERKQRKSGKQEAPNGGERKGRPSGKHQTVGSGKRDKHQAAAAAATTVNDEEHEPADEDQPTSEGFGPEGVEPGGAKEIATESNPDLKRLGLN